MWMTSSPKLSWVPEKPVARRYQFSRWAIGLRAGSWTLLGFVAFLAAWEAIAAIMAQPILVPSPQQTVFTTYDLLRDGILLNSMIASLGRIIGGWLLGALVGIPLGLLMGTRPVVRAAASPFVEGLRYIPPIAFVGLFVAWFGTGELSKILLVSYATFFIIVLNTMAGALSVPAGLQLAARTLGASPHAIYFQVVLPSAIPHMATALRMALGNAFIVIAAAEMLSANSGMGFLIWSSRSLMLTDQIFVGFLVLGVMGLTMDRVLRTALIFFLPHYRIV